MSAEQIERLRKEYNVAVANGLVIKARQIDRRRNALIREQSWPEATALLASLEGHAGYCCRHGHPPAFPLMACCSCGASQPEASYGSVTGTDTNAHSDEKQSDDNAHSQADE